jgi:hypothetical protein
MWPAVAFAQPSEPSAAEQAAAFAACGSCGGAMILIPIAAIVTNVALLIWVAKDAKSRGMESSLLWMILVMITGIFGWAIYFYSRPKGELVPCGHCENKRLKVGASCPHCGNA